MKIVIYLIIIIILLFSFVTSQDKIKELYRNEIHPINRNDEAIAEYQKKIEKSIPNYDERKIGYYSVFVSNDEIKARELIGQEYVTQYKIYYRDSLDFDLNHLLDFKDLKHFFNTQGATSVTDKDINDFIILNSPIHNNNNNNLEKKTTTTTTTTTTTATTTTTTTTTTIDYSSFLTACIKFHKDFDNLHPLWKFSLNGVAINRTEEMNKIADEALARYSRLRREYDQAMKDIDEEIKRNLVNFKSQYEQITGKKLEDK